MTPWEGTRRNFQKTVDEEVTLSLAMMSDAGEDNLELVRFLGVPALP